MGEWGTPNRVVTVPARSFQHARQRENLNAIAQGQAGLEGHRFRSVPCLPPSGEPSRGLQPALPRSAAGSFYSVPSVCRQRPLRSTASDTHPRQIAQRRLGLASVKSARGQIDPASICVSDLSPPSLPMQDFGDDTQAQVRRAAEQCPVTTTRNMKYRGTVYDGCKGRIVATKTSAASARASCTCSSCVQRRDEVRDFDRWVSCPEIPSACRSTVHTRSCAHCVQLGLTCSPEHPCHGS